jgi:hypothetical protein
VAALFCGYLVFVAGRQLTKAELIRPAGPSPALAAAGGRVAARATGTELRKTGPASWLAALGSCLAESIVYAGLAAGAIAERWTGVWALAIAVIGLVAVRNLMTVCSTPPGFGEQPDTVLGRICYAALTMPVGGRVVLVGIVAPFWGARAALLALLDWAIISVGFGIAGRAAPAMTRESAPRGRPGTDKAPDTLIRLRDDGALARGLGMLVRGNLIPLPPAVLGLAAIAALAVLGLHGLPGALTLGPALVMLLAAPGSAHPHTGRFDWLVPVLLLGAQVLYLGATGFASGVPGPVTFALVAALVLRYCELAFPWRPVVLARSPEPGVMPVERGSGIGWEGRMLLAGLGAAMGIAMYVYVALTAYLALLVCVKVVTSSLAPQEEHARDRLGYGGRREPPTAS